MRHVRAFPGAAAALSVWTLLASAPAAQQPAERLDLHVLFVGAVDTPRTASFREFLARHAAKVTAAGRDGFDPSTAAAADVVVLDWPQDAGRGEWPPTTAPLGERARWDQPTVLVGSAGLLLAYAWHVKGGAG